MGVSDTLAELSTAEMGLSLEESKLRFQRVGPNVLPSAHVPGPLRLFLEQFASPLVYVLFAAAVAILYVGEVADGLIICAVLLFNALVGAIQEGRAQNTLQSLKKMVETRAAVIRDGALHSIPDSAVVPGDIVELSEGDTVPADARIIQAHQLLVDESPLTGESTPVEKTEDALSREVEVAERTNMVFKGTHVVGGGATCVAVATGASTIVGGIARRITSIVSDVPLKRQIRNMSRVIIAATFALSLVLFAAGSVRGIPAGEMLATVISLAVSLIPEGLPIVVTLVLATGAWRMSKRHALVKRLQAVEALSHASVLAVDKTGTLTKNEMVVQRVYAGGELYEVSGEGYEPTGEIHIGGETVEPLNHPGLVDAARLAAFCANAWATKDERGIWRVSGDPTEAALAVFARKIGFKREELDRESPEVADVLFNSKTRYHAVVRLIEDEPYLAVAGAPEVLLELSTHVLSGGESRTISPAAKEELAHVVNRMSAQGMRVIALAGRKKAKRTIEDGSVRNLTLVALIGMRDGLRLEVKDAVERAKEAGVRVVMITGDHALTAKAIATEAGIYENGDVVMSGSELDELSEAALKDRVGSVSVFSRVTPEHKLRVIEAYRANKRIIAMTGDGVNDAPSLVAADLGVAMGGIGTEVAKEASDIVLLDDNIGTIVSAIEEGRNIYRTIKKVVLYLFSTSLGEVFVITVALFSGMPLPLLPAQIIWLNLVTDGFLDVALAMEPKEKGLLRGALPRRDRHLFDAGMVGRSLAMALPMMAGTLFLFSVYYAGESAKAWTVSLTVLSAFQWFNAWNCRHPVASLFRTDPRTNLYLLGATAVVVGLQMFAVYAPLLQGILHTAPLALADWLVVLVVASTVVIVEEIRKGIVRGIDRASRISSPRLPKEGPVEEAVA